MTDDDDATVNIADVEPSAVRGLARELRSGNQVFDVWGNRYRVLVVAPKRNGNVAITREDGWRELLGGDESITYIPTTWADES